MPPLPDFKPAKSDGTLPLDATASQFQYSHALHYVTSLDGLGIAYQEAKGRWRVQFISNGTVIFEQMVELTFGITSLGFSGLQFVAWQIVKEKITSFIINGEAINNLNPAWKYTVGGTELSEFGITIPGGGGDYVDQELNINVDWQSTIYNMKVPVGTKLKVVFDSWGLGVQSRPEYGFRFGGVAGGLSLWMDRVGAVRGAIPLGQRVFATHAYNGPASRRYLAHIDKADSPVIWKDRTNRLWITALKEDSYRLWYSDLDGVNLQPLLYTFDNITNDQDGLEGKQVSIWSKAFSNVDVQPLRGGGSASTAQRDGRQWFTSSSTLR